MPNDKITLPEAAARLRLPHYAAYRLMTRGLLGPAEQIAGRWLLDAKSVEAYTDQRGNPATTDTSLPDSAAAD